MVWMGLTGESLVLGPYFIEGGMDTYELCDIMLSKETLEGSI